MNRGSLIVFAIIHINYVFCGEKPSNLPCKTDDIECTTHLTQWIYDQAIAGNAEKGIENLDPLYVDVIESNQEFLTGALKNNSVEGYKDCSILNASFKPDISKMHLVVFCPRNHMTGVYDIDGKIINFPIKGHGDYFFTTTKYNISVDADISVHKKENHLHAKLKTYKINKADLLGTVDFELKNLFDGNKELSDPIHKFGKENPQPFMTLLDRPIFKAIVKKLMKNFNSVLKETPLEELLQVNESDLKIHE